MALLYLHFLCGTRSQTSFGRSVTIVLTSWWHCSGPGTKPQPAGPHSRWGTFSHLVTGFALDLNSLAIVQTSLGHLLHFSSVTYPLWYQWHVMLMLIVEIIYYLDIVTLFLIFSSALGHIIHHSVGIIPGPALAHVFRATHLGAWQVAVLIDKYCSVLH